MPKFNSQDPILILIHLLDLAHRFPYELERKYGVGEEEFEAMVEDLEDKLRAKGYLLE